METDQMTNPTSPGGAGEALVDDYEWAYQRVVDLCANALADAQVYRQKLLKGFGYPNETFRAAQDYRALRIVLDRLTEQFRQQEAWQPLTRVDGVPGTPHGDLPQRATGDSSAPVRDADGVELCGVCCENYSTHDVESDDYTGPVCDECDGSHGSGVAGPDDRKASASRAADGNAIPRPATSGMCRNGFMHYCPNCDNSFVAAPPQPKEPR
jgi:hypothetical protein